MPSSIPPPNPRVLLPPLLACLPTAFASPRPPPALLPLLSPILRQRVQLLSSIPTTVPTDNTASTTSTPSTTNSWLPLLSRSADSADSLPTLASSPAFEPHPASSEIEFRDVDNIRYRRLDEETLQAKLDVRDLGLVVVYLWCVGDVEGGGDGWRVAEVLSETDEEGKGQGWTTGITEAGEKARERVLKAVGESGVLGQKEGTAEGDSAGGEDDDAYWAQYDNTPSRTPGPRKLSVAPSVPLRTALGKEKGTSEEEQYFAQYAGIQPALDNDDPSEGVSPGESSLRGDEIGKAMQASRASNLGVTPTRNEISMSQPRASSSSSAGSNAVPRLEKAAARGAVEIGVRQHISTSIKSLFRLAQATGIEREEFERLVKTETEALWIME